VGVAQDLLRGIEGMDAAIDKVPCRPPEPFQPAPYPKRVHQGEEAGVAGKAVVVERLDVRVTDLVGGDASAEVAASLVDLDLVISPEGQGGRKTGQPTPDDADLHILFPVLIGKGG